MNGPGLLGGLGRQANLTDLSSFSEKVASPGTVAVTNSLIFGPPATGTASQTAGGVWGAAARNAALAAVKRKSTDQDDGDVISDDSDGEDRVSGVLGASYHVGAVRAKQVLGYARRASSLLELLAQWKDGTVTRSRVV